MTLSNTKQKIIKKVGIGEEISPFLFVGQNLELLSSDIKSLANDLFEEFSIPSVNLFVLEDNGEKIKIEEIKNFVNPSNIKTPYKFQIFFIENISRMTLQASNSCLKFFEEPGIKNIIFLSNTGENSILETILSRVQVVSLYSDNISKKDGFYYNLIEEGLKSGDYKSIISYVFRNKLEKEDSIKVLENIILYLMNNFLLVDRLSEIRSDINAVKQNNVNVRGVLDKWVLEISK